MASVNLLGWSYRYVGPPDLRALVRPEAEGRSIHSAADFDDWASTLAAVELAEPFTFVIDSAGVLRLAPRRSEHVVCAGGGPVLGAGEMSFREESGQWVVGEVSNQSTGYCPDISSWPAVEKALDAAGIDHPSCFTHEVVFRRCLACGQLSSRPRLGRCARPYEGHTRPSTHEHGYASSCMKCSGEGESYAHAAAGVTARDRRATARYPPPLHTERPPPVTMTRGGRSAGGRQTARACFTWARLGFVITTSSPPVEGTTRTVGTV